MMRASSCSHICRRQHLHQCRRSSHERRSGDRPTRAAGSESLAGRDRGRDSDLHGGSGHNDCQCALRYIAGGLSAPQTDSEWVITSYLVANAIVLPISGWLATRLGRRNYFLLSIAIAQVSPTWAELSWIGIAVAFGVLQRVYRA